MTELTAESAAALRARVFSLWKDTGLPDEDRHEFAGMILGRDVHSFQGMHSTELQRLVDALAGWLYVWHLQTQRGVR